MATKIKEINLNDITPSKLPLVIGYFGSVHVMHRQLFDKSHRYNVLTFKDFKKKSASQLYTYKERINNIAEFKPNNIFVFDINKHNMKAERFVQEVLMALKPTSIIVGSNFKFGSDHKSWQILNKDFVVETIQYNKSISSSKIAELLRNKKVEIANGYLDKPYYYIGKWVGGNKQGKEIGHPTINLLIDHPLFVCEGSYATRITIGSRKFNAVTFVGKSKTIAKKESVVETHVIGKHIPPRILYPKSVRDSIKIEFFKFLRSNTKYKNKTLLSKAIAKDLDKAKAFLARNK